MKNYFYLLPLLLLSFTACEGDDDNHGFGDDDDDDDSYAGVSFNYTPCEAAQIFSSSEKSNLQILNVENIPVEIRAFIASDYPDTEVVEAESFEDSLGNTFYEVVSDHGIIFVFTANATFICAYE